MKKRLVALLLALGMVLTLAPFALAEGEEEPCTHPETETGYYFTDLETLTYETVDERHHVAKGPGVECEYCVICGEIIREDPVAEVEDVQMHDFDEEGVCTLCGYVNACTHENSYEWIAYDDYENVTYESVDEKTHIVHGSGTIGYTCEDCGMTFGEEEVADLAEVERHVYDANGVCEACGHENGCPHENTVPQWFIYDYDSAVYESVDDKFHTVTGLGESFDYCLDCDTDVHVQEDVMLTVSEGHSYDDDGVCRACGHENGCPHRNVYFYNDFDRNAATYTDDGNGVTHTVRGDGEEMMVCQDCYTVLERTPFLDRTATEAHAMEDDVCVWCGYESTCTHENTYSYQFVAEVIEAEPVDETSCQVTCTQWKIVRCKDCDELISQQILPASTIVMVHSFENGFCTYCGAENECPHEYIYTDTRMELVREVVDVTEQTHTLRGILTEEEHCDQCGMLLEKTYDDDALLEESHQYRDEACVICGYVNTCPHEHMEQDFYFDPDDCAFEPVDHAQHRVTGFGWIRDYCPDCGEEFPWDVTDDLNVLMNHEFEDGVCVWCGAPEQVTVFPLCEVENGDAKLVFFNNGILWYVKEGSDTVRGWWRLPNGKLQVHLEVPGKVARAHGLTVKIGTAAFTLTEEQMNDLNRLEAE